MLTSAVMEGAASANVTDLDERHVLALEGLSGELTRQHGLFEVLDPELKLLLDVLLHHAQRGRGSRRHGLRSCATDA